MLRRLIAVLRYGTPLAIAPGYARLLREIKRRKGLHLSTRHLRAKQREIVHAALRGGTAR